MSLLHRRAVSARALLTSSARVATLVYVGAAETACNISVSPCSTDPHCNGTTGTGGAGGTSSSHVTSSTTTSTTTSSTSSKSSTTTSGSATSGSTTSASGTTTGTGG